MLNLLLINAAFALSQPVPGEVLPPPNSPVAPGFSAPLASPAPLVGTPQIPNDGLFPAVTQPVSLPALNKAPARASIRLVEPDPKGASPKPEVIEAPLLVIPPAKPAEAAAAAPAATPAVRWELMKALQGTYYGALLDDNRLYLYGWLEASMNGSTANVSNLPVTWTDRANEPMFQQGWIRFGRSLVTSGTTDITYGFQADFLIGSDYRFTLPRGLLNSQLENANGNQNLYGVDPIQHYVCAYVPTLFSGTEFRAGRLYTPWGVESLEAVSTPLVTRSYAFNWSPPFTHSGVGAFITFNPEWSAVLMAVNGNDVYFGDPSAEWRFVGNIKWTQPRTAQNTVTLATSVGRGKFNAGDPYAPATIALPNEPLGRNNFNAFDVVWTHTFNTKWSYNMEGIWAYQTNVPGIANSTGYGLANWFSLAHYLFYTISPEWTATGRFETFDDFQGQRTGFRGLYTSITGGMSYKPLYNVTIRPELRYDYCNDSRPFEGKHGIFVAVADLIIRF